MPMFDLLKSSDINERSNAVPLISYFIVFALVASADYATSDQLSFTTFYLIVVLPVSWMYGIRWGGLFAFLSTFSDIHNGVLSTHTFSKPIYVYINNVNILSSYLATAILASIAGTLYERAKHAARIDHLTGITNSLGFYERLAIEIARHRRDFRHFAVAYIDCDNFKLINDRYGHNEGDKLLSAIGKTLKSTLRESDVVARLGGDEFALVFPDTGELSALDLTEKLRGKLDAVVKEHDWPVTFSIGIGLFPVAPVNLDQVIAFSDNLMYTAKAEGKNKIVHRVFCNDKAQAESYARQSMSNPEPKPNAFS